MVLFKRFGRIQLSLQAVCNEVLAPPSLFELVWGRGIGRKRFCFLGWEIVWSLLSTARRDNNKGQQ